MGFEQAKPVWVKKLEKEWNILLSFTAEVENNGGTYRFTAAADNFYRLSVNGRFVFFGPERCAKGWWRTDEIDLTGYLEKGLNHIEVEVLHYGVGAFYYVNQPPFAAFEILCDGRPVCYTSADRGGFEVRRNLSKEQKVERSSYQRPFMESYELPFVYSEKLECAEVTGIRLLKRGAPIPEFREVYPERKIASGHFEIQDYAKEEAKDRRIINIMENYCYDPTEIPVIYSEKLRHFKITDSQSRDEKAVCGEVSLMKAGEFCLYKMEREKTGFLFLTIQSTCDCEIWLAVDEVLSGGFVDIMERNGDFISLIRLRVKKGENRFRSMEPVCVHYLQIYCLEGEAEISGIGLTEYENPDVKRAVFESSREDLDRIFRAAVATYVQNSVDVYMDCPSRERAGWLCDSFFTSRVERDLSGASAVEHDFLENFILADEFDLPEGMLPMCYPSEQLEETYIPNWAMWFVIELEEYYKRSGDRKLADDAEKRVYDLLKYFEKFENADGLLEKLEGWVFVEWSDANKWTQDINYPSNMLYYRMLCSAAQLYADSRLEEKAEKLKKTINRCSYNGRFFEDNAMLDQNGARMAAGNISEVCQYYAFFCRVADADSHPQLLEKIIRDFGPGKKVSESLSGGSSGECLYRKLSADGNIIREWLSKADA